MDYKKLAAAGMSVALALSVGGAAFAKAPEDVPPDNPDAAQEEPVERKAGTDRHSGAERQKHDGAGQGNNGEKPEQKPERKLDQMPDSGISTDWEKKETPKGNGRSSHGSHASETADTSGKTGRSADAKSEKPESKEKASTDETGKSKGSKGNSESGKTESSAKSGGKQKPGSGGTAVIAHDAANTLSESADGKMYHSSGDSENAVLVDGDKVTLSGVTVSKTGSASGDNADFYGINATVLAKSGAELTISGAEITSNGAHANGVFSYGEGTTVRISDSTITTTGNTSGGLMTTGGGTMIADNLTVKTSGNSSAAIRSDRGGGTVTVNGGSYTSSGVGSPAIYSTADITVNGATLTSTASEGVVVEGKNSVTLNNVTLTDTNNRHAGKSSTDKNIFLYQSMSGDASVGTAQFTANDSTIVTNQGDTIYVTNTTAEITLKNNTLVNNAGGALLRAEAAKWGTSGKNGGSVKLTLDAQKASGDVVADAISTVSLTLKNGSDYAGAVNGADTAKQAAVTLEQGSKWTLTGDSYVSSLSGDLSGIDLGGHTLYVNGAALSGTN